MCYSVHIWFFRWIGFLLLPKTRCSKIGRLFSECSTMQVKSVIKRAYVWEKEKKKSLLACLLNYYQNENMATSTKIHLPLYTSCYLLRLPTLLGLPSTDRKKLTYVHDCTGISVLRSWFPMTSETTPLPTSTPFLWRLSPFVR